MAIIYYFLILTMNILIINENHYHSSPSVLYKGYALGIIYIIPAGTGVYSEIYYLHIYHTRGHGCLFRNILPAAPSIRPRIMVYVIIMLVPSIQFPPS